MRQPMGKRNVVCKEGARIPISSKASKIPLPAAQEPCTWKHICMQKCARFSCRIGPQILIPSSRRGTSHQKFGVLISGSSKKKKKNKQLRKVLVAVYIFS